MRFFYLLLFFTLKLSTRLYFRRRATHNSPKEYLGRTIYVSNHAASFMDPLVIASFRKPIVFFMTRSDVFKPLLKPVLWAAHMLPIYRQHDGEDTKGKNEEVFKASSKVLNFGRNILIFGEGFTDDVFIRRLKPVKKGAARIGFTALESLNWKKKVYIAAVGCNYTEPNYMRSDILISTSDKICLNDYKAIYDENPNKAIAEVTRLIEIKMREQITHVEDAKLAPFHENIMQLTRKGMNARSYDKKLSLKERWKYSQKLANWLNEQDIENDEKLNDLKTKLEDYFKLLKKLRLDENDVYNHIKNISRMGVLLKLIFLFPFAILGMIHFYLPYLFVKRFVEKSFKRRVFWGSVKILMGKAIMGIINIPFIFVFYHFVYPSYWLGFFYYTLIIPLFGLSAYLFFRNLKEYKLIGHLQTINLSKIIVKRAELLEEIEREVLVS
jgi:hypothetical protein